MQIHDYKVHKEVLNFDDQGFELYYFKKPQGSFSFEELADVYNRSIKKIIDSPLSNPFLVKKYNFSEISESRAKELAFSRKAIADASLSLTQQKYCSLTHTKEGVFFVFSERPVGIDAELKVREISQRTIDKFLSRDKNFQKSNIKPLEFFMSLEASFKFLSGRAKLLSELKLKSYSEMLKNGEIIFEDLIINFRLFSVSNHSLCLAYSL